MVVSVHVRDTAHRGKADMYVNLGNTFTFPVPLKFLTRLADTV